MKRPLSNAGTEADENRLFWFPFYVNEWIADRSVRFMKDYERGWYISLIVESWSYGGTLPDDPNVLWKLAGAQSQEFFEGNSAGVLSEFDKYEVEGKPVLLCRRMASVYAKQDKKYRQTCDAARISAEKRRLEKARQEVPAGETSQGTDKVGTVQ